MIRKEVVACRFYIHCAYYTVVVVIELTNIGHCNVSVTCRCWKRTSVLTTSLLLFEWFMSEWFTDKTNRIESHPVEFPIPCLPVCSYEEEIIQLGLIFKPFLSIKNLFGSSSTEDDLISYIYNIEMSIRWEVITLIHRSYVEMSISLQSNWCFSKFIF